MDISGDRIGALVLAALLGAAWGCEGWPERGVDGVCYPDEHDQDDLDCACKGPCEVGWGCVDGGCVCIPDCADSTCGSDGCDGSCGNCPPGETCRSGVCVPACGDGICDPQTEDACGCPLDCGPVCGDGCCSSYEGPCDCPEDCGDPCADRACGPDGCGGDCGGCGGGEVCLDDGSTCVEDCVNECVPGEVHCDGDQIITCGSYEGPNETTCWELSDPSFCGPGEICDEMAGGCVCLSEDCGAYNLKMTDLSCEGCAGTFPSGGEITVTLTATFVNEGDPFNETVHYQLLYVPTDQIANQPCPAHPLGFFLGLLRASVSGMEAGEEVTEEFVNSQLGALEGESPDFPDVPPGEYQLYYMVDSHEVLAEIDECDNYLTNDEWIVTVTEPREGGEK